MLELKNVSYHYQTSSSVPVVDAANLKVSIGDRAGIVGANGSGKSTLLKIAASLLRPTSGQVFWRGKDIYSNLAEFRAAINYEEFGSLGFYPRLGGVENLRFFSALKGEVLSCFTAQRLLSDVGLDSASWTKHYVDYSLGMRQRLHLARALLPGAELLLLDEPTNGLDEVGRQLAGQVCLRAAENKALVVVSHDADFLSKVANRRYNMHAGKLVEMS